jgi:hypothetical protein
LGGRFGLGSKEMRMNGKTTVFVSYAQDTADHKAAVKALADEIGALGGVDCDLDQYHERDDPPGGWPSWMQAQIANRDLVVVVGSPAYRKRFEQQEEPEVGLGAKYESILISNRFFHYEGTNTGIIPVHFGPGAVKDLPLLVRELTRFDVADPTSRTALLQRIRDRRVHAPTAESLPNLVVASGYLRPSLRYRVSDAMFIGPDFAFEAKGMERGPTPALTTPIEPARHINLGTFAIGSFLGSGPARLGRTAYSTLAYAGRLTIYSTSVALNSDDAEQRFSARFALAGVLRGFEGAPMVLPTTAAKLAVRLFGEGTVTITFKRGSSDAPLYWPVHMEYVLGEL